MSGSIIDKVENALGLNTESRDDVEAIIAGWPERPRLGATMMLDKYGAPTEATGEQLVWRNQGAYQKITVTRDEHHHDFPKPHMDFLEHTIAFRVPPERAAELSRYDGSCTFDRTRGTMSARCDLEGHNILTLNLAKDIVDGKYSAEEARKVFGEIVTDDVKGKYPDYTTDLRFTPEKSEDVKFADVPSMPGSPVRPDGMAEMRGDKDDGEVLGFIQAGDELEAISANVAHSKKMGNDAARFSQMLHEAHGANLEKTLQLAQQLGITPLETPAIDTFRRKAAGELADLTALDGDAFEEAYLAAKVKGHTEMIAMLDGKLMSSANNDVVKSHVRATREHLIHHLAQAKALRPAMSWDR